MSVGSMSLPELLQEPRILPPRSDLRTFLARSCFSSNSTKRARSRGREPGILRSSLNFLPNTLGVAAWSSICTPTFDQPTRSASARFLTKRGVFTSGGSSLKGAAHNAPTLAVVTVIVEDASRLARELVVQELGIALLAKRGVRLLTASGDDLTDSNDLGCKMMRQVAGAFMEYEKGCQTAQWSRAQAQGDRQESRWPEITR